MINNKTTVVIATSLKRTDWLIERSLKSVYTQKNIDKYSVSVIIVDDNEDANEFKNIIEKVDFLRNEINLSENEFPTQILKNTRTRFMSGTGAWNTGIWETYKNYPNGFVSILDDDEYLPNHLADCLKSVDENTLAVFQWLYWKNDDNSEMYFPFTINDLSANSFFIGNPGVQGSNMFFKVKSLIDIDGFDENLPNTTDRDLMIRFLCYFDSLKEITNSNIKVVESIGVAHYNHKKQKVNNDFEKKHLGLDLFYQKYKTYFSEEAYKKSLLRARNFFNYVPQEQR